MDDRKIQLAQEILLLDDQIRDAERSLKGLKKQQKLIESRLIDVLIGEGLTQIKTDGGKKISIKQKMFTGFKVEFRDQVFAWLHEIGRPDAIKTDVNKSTLRKIVRECMEEGVTEIPTIIDLTILNEIDIRDSKNKSLRNPREDED